MRNKSPEAKGAASQVSLERQEEEIQGKAGEEVITPDKVLWSRVLVNALALESGMPGLQSWSQLLMISVIADELLNSCVIISSFWTMRWLFFCSPAGGIHYVIYTKHCAQNPDVTVPYSKREKFIKRLKFRLCRHNQKKGWRKWKDTSSKLALDKKGTLSTQENWSVLELWTWSFLLIHMSFRLRSIIWKGFGFSSLGLPLRLCWGMTRRHWWGRGERQTAQDA